MGGRVIGFWNTEAWTRVIAYVGIGGYPIWLLLISLQLREELASGQRRKIISKQEGFELSMNLTLYSVTSVFAIVFCLLGTIFSVVLLAGVVKNNLSHLVAWTRWTVVGIVFSFIYFLIGSNNGNTAVLSVHIIYILINLFFLYVVQQHIGAQSSNRQIV